MSKILKENQEKRDTRIHKKPETKSKQDIQKLIFELADKETEERFSDASLDRENAIITLLGGGTVTLREIKTIVTGSPQPHAAIFTKETEFYQEIFRLNGWDIKDSFEYYKPSIVGKFTNELIYSRFLEGVLPMLQKLNPYISLGARRHKNYHFLTEHGKQKVEEFISQAVEVMKTCNSWYEFRVEYHKQYNVSYQFDLFKEAEIH